MNVITPRKPLRLLLLRRCSVKEENYKCTRKRRRSEERDEEENKRTIREKEKRDKIRGSEDKEMWKERER